jgi:hypothetical protein
VGESLEYRLLDNVLSILVLSHFHIHKSSKQLKVRVDQISKQVPSTLEDLANE